MGGKHKQAQRIKNNARPSSSGRSAELLASSSSQIGSTMKEIRFIPPTLSLMKTEEFDTSVSPAFQIVFKKMNKKDCTTKIKALQEFSDLIATSEPEAVKTILAFWATLYSILATDADHRVREAVHNAHYQIISKDKKMIAPFLKQLIGPWFTSQYDNYPPAASAASKAFTAAFPANKLQDCVVFCQKEILTYIYDNLTSKLDSVKTTSNEESEAKFERIIISSLQGYCLYLNSLNTEQIEKADELNLKICSNSRFLKLATHKSALIRASWFKVLATLYHKALFLLKDLHQQIVPLVFNNLDENEPAVVGFVWEAALLIMNLLEEWWTFIQVDKCFVVKLKKVLREGGHGSASAIYPNLLSLLNKLPPSLKTEPFYDAFFENLRLGLKRKSVLSSRSESTAVVTALVESLQYVILINQENEELCEKLIKSHLLPLLCASLKTEEICFRTIFHHITFLIQYWNRNKTIENYSKYQTLFWTNLTDLLENTFNELTNEDLVDRQITLLQHLKQVAKPKEQMKVKFSSESATRNDSHVTQIDESYTSHVTNLAYTLIKCYVTQIQNKRTQWLLQHLFSIVRLFESRDFLFGLCGILQEKQLLSLYQTLLFDWLKSTDLSTEVVVDLAFVLIKYLSSEEKTEILTSFLQLSKEAFGWCLKNAFSHPYNQDLTVQSWLRHAKVGDFLIEITDTNLTLDCPPDLRNLFKMAFTENCNQFLIDTETLMKIIETVQKPLSHPENYETSIDACVHLASFVSDKIYNEINLLKYTENLLLSLFEFSCKDHVDLEFLTDDTQYEISTSWQDVVATLSASLPKQEMLDLTEKFAKLVEVIFLGENSNANQIIDTIVNYIKSIDPVLVTEVFHLFFTRSFVPTWKKQIHDLCLHGEFLYGQLAVIPQDLDIIMSEDDIFKYFQWIRIKVGVLSEQYDEEVDILDEYLVADVIYDLATLKSYLRHYKMSKIHTNLVKHYEELKTKTKQLLDAEIEEALKQKLQHSNELFTSNAIYVLHQDLKNDTELSTFSYYYKRTENREKRLHLVQLYSDFINFDNIDLTALSLFDNVVVLRSLAHCDEIEVQIAEVFEKVKKYRNENISQFLMENGDISSHHLETIIEVIRLMSKLITLKFDSLSRQYWDFSVISLTTWVTNCFKQRMTHKNPQIQGFILAVTDLYISICQKMTDVNVKSYVDEWNDIFLSNIHSDLLQLWLYFTDQFATNQIALMFHPLLQQFGNVTDHYQHKFIFGENTPKWSKIVKRCHSLFINSSPILQIWGYKMLIVLIPGLIQLDLESNSSTNLTGFTVEQFKDILQQTHSIVDGLLAAFKLGEDSCQVTPFTDSYTYVFGYLLLWGVLLQLCEKSGSELRYQYAEWFRNNESVKTLLNNLFKLMPTEILHYSEGKSKVLSKLFVEKPNLSLTEPCTSERLEHTVCWIYTFCLSQLPALVRQWWTETETKVTQIVERVTAFYVSPQLCNQELQDVGHRENNFKNMTIKIIPSVREVVAIYAVDEAQMELVITLPQNYPLGDPDVRCNKQIGGPLHKQWLMQLKKYLLHQNGRIWDGLALWNGNLDKKFDGVEECYICFAVLHPGTYQLPKLSCGTCRKKFHSACLYKWFSTSNKSSCPICRNLF